MGFVVFFFSFRLCVANFAIWTLIGSLIGSQVVMVA